MTIEAAEAPPAVPAAEEPQERRKFRRSKVIEVLTAFLLAAAGALSAWSGYQASLWGGQQSASYAEAEALRVRAAQASTFAGQLAAVDASLFVAWSTAKAENKPQLQELLESEMRVEFKPTFEQWLRLPAAPPTPFHLPSYRASLVSTTTTLSAQAAKIQERGDEANGTSDFYGRATVMFALSLFFAGIAGQFKHLSVRAAVLSLAGALLVLGISLMAALPKAMPG